MAESVQAALTEVGTLLGGLPGRTSNSILGKLNEIIELIKNTQHDTHFRGSYPSVEALEEAYPTASDGDYAYVGVEGEDAQLYIWDNSDSKWVDGGGAGVEETPASIKTKYESNANTNAFTDTDKAKLNATNQLPLYFQADGAQIRLGGEWVSNYTIRCKGLRVSRFSSLYADGDWIGGAFQLYCTTDLTDMLEAGTYIVNTQVGADAPGMGFLRLKATGELVARITHFVDGHAIASRVDIYRDMNPEEWKSCEGLYAYMCII
jgi:hypothetical protein